MSVNIPIIAAGATTKRAGKGFTMIAQVPVAPPEPYAFENEEGELVFVEQTPQRAGQIVAVVTAESRYTGSIYVVADVGGGVLEWKQAF